MFLKVDIVYYKSVKTDHTTVKRNCILFMSWGVFFFSCRLEVPRPEMSDTDTSKYIHEKYVLFPESTLARDMYNTLALVFEEDVYYPVRQGAYYIQTEQTQFDEIKYFYRKTKLGRNTMHGYHITMKNPSGAEYTLSCIFRNSYDDVFVEHRTMGPVMFYLE